jgi:hypothetical protein
MCTLIAEIIMLIGGLYALIAGKLKLTKNLRLEGWRASSWPLPCRSHS